MLERQDHAKGWGKRTTPEDASLRLSCARMRKLRAGLQYRGRVRSNALREKEENPAQRGDFQGRKRAKLGQEAKGWILVGRGGDNPSS